MGPLGRQIHHRCRKYRPAAQTHLPNESGSCTAFAGCLVETLVELMLGEQGKAINGLVHDYVKFKVKNQAMQNPNQGGGATDDS